MAAKARRRAASAWRPLLAVAAGVALAGFIVSPALGGPGFLTSKEANRQYLKKRAAAKRYLGKGEANRRFLTTAAAEARYLRPEGPIRISTGGGSWAVEQGFGPAPTTKYTSEGLEFEYEEVEGSASAGAEMIPDIPVLLYGRQMKLVSAEFCWRATEAAQRRIAHLYVITEDGGIGHPPESHFLDMKGAGIDETSGGNSCWTLAPTAPYALGPADQVRLFVGVGMPMSVQPLSGTVVLGRATFVLES